MGEEGTWNLLEKDEQQIIIKQERRLSQIIHYFYYLQIWTVKPLYKRKLFRQISYSKYT